jgi:hypothetical protein
MGNVSGLDVGIQKKSHKKKPLSTPFYKFSTGLSTERVRKG